MSRKNDPVEGREIHSDKIDHTVSESDLIEPDLVGDDMILNMEIDDDGMVQALIEADGLLIQAHRPSEQLLSDPVEDTGSEPRWCVGRAGDFSTVI